MSIAITKRTGRDFLEQRSALGPPGDVPPPSIGAPQPGGVGPAPGDLEGTPLMPGILGPGDVGGDPRDAPTLPVTPPSEK